MDNRLKSRLNWHNVTTWTCWLRKMTLTSPSSRSVVASWWTTNTSSLTSIKNRVIHVAAASCCLRRTLLLKGTSWRRACLSSSTSPKRLLEILTTPCSTYLWKKTGTIRRSSATACTVSYTFMTRTINVNLDHQSLIECCARVKQCALHRGVKLCQESMTDVFKFLKEVSKISEGIIRRILVQEVNGKTQN